MTVLVKTSGGDSAASAASNEATPTAPVAPTTAPDTSLTLTTDKGLITTAVPGQDIVVIGTGFAAYSTVQINIYSSATALGTATTDSAGNFTKPVTIPAALASGLHTAIAQGVAPDGTPRAMRLAITVGTHAAAAGTAGSLPVTGDNTAAIVRVALMLLFGGSGLLVLGRRRRV